MHEEKLQNCNIRVHDFPQHGRMYPADENERGKVNFIRHFLENSNIHIRRATANESSVGPNARIRSFSNLICAT